MDDDRRMAEEYRSHFKAMIPSLAWLFCALVMGFVLWDIAFSGIIYPLQREVDYINESKYSFVIESSNDYGDYSRLKKLDNIITFTNEQGKRLNANTYIPVETALLGEWNLQKNEIAVSQKLADKLSLSVGSMVSADYPVYDQPMEYEVKVILPYASDLYNMMDSQDFSYAVVGDDGVLLNQAKGTWTYFLNAQENEEYYEKNNSYINRFDLAEEKENLYIVIAVRYAALVVIMLTLVVTIAVLMHKEINREVLKYYYDGYEICHVKRIDRKDHFFFYGIPCIVQIIWVALFIRKAEYPIAFFLCVFVILFSMHFITMFVGGRKYGKAN